ncbi:MAG: lactoylglutathione lyase [Rhodospirillaceae bacterium]|nr:lactoylglutathione lyase [Rhodospirillaceae bacterium]
MKYLHTMIRVSNLDETIDFFVSNFGMIETRRIDSEQGRFTIVFLAAPEDVENANTEQSPVLELTHNWDPEEYTGGRNFGHLAYAVDNIYESCRTLMDNSVTINRPPRDGRMAFIQTPDGISIELLQKGDSLPKQEPWASMENTGSW